MNAKSIYDNLVDVQGVPSSILTYSDKEDCIIIEIQDYNKSVFKFAREFFKGYKSTDIIYTNEDKTAVWYNDVSVYSDRETIQAITDFYYRAKAKGLLESKKSTRKSIKESYDKWTTSTLKGELMKLGYFIDDLHTLPSKRHANEVIRQAETVINFCESAIYELKNAVKNNEV